MAMPAHPACSREPRLAHASHDLPPRARSDRGRRVFYRCAGRRTITTMAAATRIPAAAIAAQTHPDSPDDDATGATATAVVLVAVSATGPAPDAGEAGVASAEPEPAGSEAVADASAPLTAPSASWNLISPSTG